MTYMRSWKSLRLTSHTWLGLNPLIGRPLSRIVVPLVYLYNYEPLNVAVWSIRWQLIFEIYQNSITHLYASALLDGIQYFSMKTFIARVHLIPTCFHLKTLT
jgi:hypothetical protein